MKNTILLLILAGAAIQGCSFKVMKEYEDGPNAWTFCPVVLGFQDPFEKQ